MVSSEVRRATPGDREAVIHLLRESQEASGLDFPFSAPHADGLFRSHMERGLVLVLGEPAAGVLMAFTFDHPMGVGLWARETVWYVRPEARGRGALRMLDEYEAWARERGCVAIGMATLVSNDVSKIYERRGYSPAEIHHIKLLR